MSKMGNEFIRAAETRSLDNAAEVERLRAENAELKRQLGEALEDPPQRGRISHRGANGQWYDTAEEAAGQYTWSEGGRDRP